MGGDDFELIYSTLHYAADQPGGFISPECSQRLMNLCQTIFHDEPKKFGWTLFGRAAAASIGFPAIYKLIRWHDQDVAPFSYGLPQLVCLLSRNGHLDARRAAVLLTICEDLGWHEWQVGQGLQDLLTVADPADRQSIFWLVKRKLDVEHGSDGWEGLWGSLLTCAESFEELSDQDLRSRLKELRQAARKRNDIDNARRNHGGSRRDYISQTPKDAEAIEAAYLNVVSQLDPTSGHFELLRFSGPIGMTMVLDMV